MAEVERDFKGACASISEDYGNGWTSFLDYVCAITRVATDILGAKRDLEPEDCEFVDGLVKTQINLFD